jgi:hypothetical protein
MSQCKANCGFYGQDKLNGYCSLCSSQLKNSSDPINVPIQSMSDATTVPSMESKVLPSTETPSRSRCNQCSKKVGLLGFECACKGVYCQKCRHAESHKCTYDFSSLGKALLQKNNPVVMGMKMVRMD